MPRTLSLEHPLASPSAFATARLAQAQLGGRFATETITLDENSVRASGNGGDDDDDNVVGYVPLSSEKHHPIADNCQRSSERVETRDRAATKDGAAYHQEGPVTWEETHARDAHSAKLSASDSDDDKDDKAGLLRNPFSLNLYAPGGLPYTLTQGAVYYTPGADGEANFIATVLVPGSVTPLVSAASTKVPVALSVTAVVSPSPVPGKSQPRLCKCVQTPINEESTESSVRAEEDTIAKAMVQLPSQPSQL